MGTIIIIDIKVRNRRSYPVTKKIPRGSIVEVSDPNAPYQHAMVVRDYYITIPPNETVTVNLEAMCFIKRRQWPQGTPANLTPYTFSGLYTDQADLWGQLGY
jgi:hypothetical protein